MPPENLSCDSFFENNWNFTANDIHNNQYTLNVLVKLFSRQNFKCNASVKYSVLPGGSFLVNSFNLMNVQYFSVTIFHTIFFFKIDWFKHLQDIFRTSKTIEILIYVVVNKNNVKLILNFISMGLMKMCWCPQKMTFYMKETISYPNFLAAANLGDTEHIFFNRKYQSNILFMNR